MLDDLHARGIHDVAAVQQAVAAHPSLRGARVHPPHEHGPTASVVYVAGMTLDGGCEALLGH